MMELKVLGPGCANCKNLEKQARLALEKSGKEAVLTKVTDIAEIQKYGIMRTPALVIDEKVMVYGRVPSVKEIESWL